MRFIAFAAAAASLFVSGCAIHPLPEDVTGVSTNQIVRRIRCEARETLRQEVIDWLKKLGAFYGDNFTTLALRYENDQDAISEFSPNIFKGPVNAKIKAVAKLFFDAGIAYNFELTMTENNNDLNPLSLTFTRPVIQPVFTLGVTASATRQRTNDRTFTATDTFSYLLTKLNTPVRGVHYCDGQIVGPNYIYPITGRIGIDRMVHDFIELTLFGSLAEQTSKPGAVGAPTLADKLTFTTAFSGSINPAVVFTPITNAFQLTNASLTTGAGRSDTHQVTVGLAIDAADMVQLAGLRSFLFSSARSAATIARLDRPPPVLIGNRITAAGYTPAQLLAIVAIDQLKSRELQLIPNQ